MKRIWPIIGVRDVRRSFEWYQSLLDVAPGAPAHDDFGQIVDADGTVLIWARAHRSSRSATWTATTS